MKMTLVLFILCSGFVHFTFASNRLRVFRFIDQEKPWDESLENCTKTNESFVTLYDKGDINYIFEFVIYLNASPWLGLRKSRKNVTTWSDGIPFTFNNSDVTVTNGMPICEGIEQSKWTSFNCSDKKHFMCYKDNNYILIQNERKTWCQAQLYCRRHFTDLVSISNETQNTQVIEEGKNKTFWIGLLHDEWEWVDNSCSTFRDWDSDVSHKCINCSALSHSGSSMTGAECNDDKPTFCSKGKVRIQVVHLNLTWEDAFDYCADNHKSLLQIEDSDDQKAVEQWLNYTTGDGPFWIGLRQSRVFGFWIWRDKTVSYSNWMDGRQPEMPISDNCGVINKTDYKWRDENCWHEHPFICEEEISFMNK